MTADFAALVTQTVVEGRALAESLMTATGKASHPTGQFVRDIATDADVPEYAPMFESVCKIQTRDLQAREQEVGGRTATTVTVELHLPISAPALATGDRWQMLTSAHDAELVARTFTITAPVAKEYATARRYEVTEVVA